MKLKSRLSDIIGSDIRLLDQLLSLDVLTRRQYDDICSESRAAYGRTDGIKFTLAIWSMYSTSNVYRDIYFVKSYKITTHITYNCNKMYTVRDTAIQIKNRIAAINVSW